MTDAGVDYAGAYRGVREELTALLRDRPVDDFERVAPATPEWRVRDVVAHLAGVCDDVANGNMAGAPSDDWTAAQVDKRRDLAPDALLADWSTHATTVESFMNSIGAPIGQMVFDAWTHEQDIRGTVGAPGGRESEALEIAWVWFVESNQRPPAGVVPDMAVPPLLVETEAGEFRFGPAGEIGATVQASRFELLRAFTGRRSLAQIRALGAQGVALDQVLFANTFFTPSPVDIIE